MTGSDVRLLGVLHEALTLNGKYGGWARDRSYGRARHSAWLGPEAGSGKSRRLPILIVWQHAGEGYEQDDRVVVLEPAARGTRWSNLRLLQRVDGDLMTIADCKVSGLDEVFGVLATYGVIDEQWLIPYRRGYRKGYHTGRNVYEMREVLRVP